MIAHNPLHGSGQAGFPHPALALGDDAHAAQGIGMTDGRRRQPASDEAPHARALPLGTEKSKAHFGSGALRSTGCVHAPPLAAICPVRGWVRASAAEVRLSPRSTSSAIFCGSFAATP